MTNLFAQLAARSLGLMPIVQPRISSLFGPRQSFEAIAPAASFAERHDPNAIVQQSRQEPVSSLVDSAANPAINQFPPLPIAHLPRPLAVETVAAQTSDRDTVEQSNSEQSNSEQSNSEQSNSEQSNLTADTNIGSDRMISDRSAETSQIRKANDTTRERIQPGIVEPTSTATNLELRNETNYQTEQTNLVIGKTLNPNAVSRNPQTSGEMPQSSDSALSFLSAAETELPSMPRNSARTDSLAASISPQSAEFAIDSEPQQRRSKVEPLRSLSSSEDGEDRKDAGDRLDAVRRDRPFKSGQSESVAAAISQSQIVPQAANHQTANHQTANHQAANHQAVSQTMQPFQPRSVEVESSQSDLVLPGVMPRQIAALSAPPIDRSAFRTSEKELSAPLPTIRVTIGRIEVRAVSAPPPARPRAPQPQARLSLEDYLRSRSGGNP